jgi:hypothetical protein
MSEKDKILEYCNNIINQFNDIISLNLNSKKLRDDYGITIFSLNCQMCKPYFDKENNNCNYTDCPLSNNNDKGCLKSGTKPKDNFDLEQLRIRRLFWREIKTFIKESKDDSIFEIENRKLLQDKIVEIDNNLTKITYGNK